MMNQSGELPAWIGAYRQTVSWRIMASLGKHFPPAFQFLTYGTLNVNTKERWDHAWDRHVEKGFRARGDLEEIRERLSAAIPRGTKVLDVGCGVGGMLILLRDRGACKCFGTDISESAIAAALAMGSEA